MALQTAHSRSLYVWLLGVTGVLAAWIVAGALDRTFAAGFGGIWLTLTILLGGVAVHVRARSTPACATTPRLQPLQVSGLAALTLGVQFLRAAETPELLTLLPLLQSPWPAYLCIGGGLAILAWRSLFATCRDTALRGQAGDR
jgi:hypothetical protein